MSQLPVINPNASITVPVQGQYFFVAEMLFDNVSTGGVPLDFRFKLRGGQDATSQLARRDKVVFVEGMSEVTISNHTSHVVLLTVQWGWGNFEPAIDLSTGITLGNVTVDNIPANPVPVEIQGEPVPVAVTGGSLPVVLPSAQIVQARNPKKVIGQALGVVVTMNSSTPGGIITTPLTHLTAPPAGWRIGGAICGVTMNASSVSSLDATQSVQVLLLGAAAGVVDLPKPITGVLGPEIQDIAAASSGVNCVFDTDCYFDSLDAFAQVGSGVALNDTTLLTLEFSLSVVWVEA